MARRWHGGAETGDTSEFASITATAFTVQTAIKRSGSYAYKFVSTVGNNQQQASHALGSTGANINEQFWERWWIYVPSTDLPSASRMIIAIATTTGTLRASIAINTDLTLSLLDASAAQLGSASAAIVPDTWNYVCLYYDARTTTATVTGYLNSSSAFATSTFAVGGAGAGVGAIGFIQNTAGTGTIYFDDGAVNDGSGTNDNGLPSLTEKIVHLYPNAAGDTNGTNATDFDSGPVTGVGLANFFTMIDEGAPADDATSYLALIVASTGATNRFLDFNIQASSAAGIGASDTIKSVSVGYRFSALTAASASLVARVKSQASGTVTEGSAVATAVTAWNTYDDTVLARVPSLVSYTDPQLGGAWTPALLNSAQIGMRAPDATPDVLVTSLWLTVAYEPAPSKGFPFNLQQFRPRSFTPTTRYQ